MDGTPLQCIIDDFFGLYDSSTSIDVAPDHVKSGIFAHGWYTAVRRTARACLVLAADGYEHEAAPLRRSMIEHALALHWLADASDAAVDALLRAHQNRLQKMREPMSAGDWSVPIDVLDSFLDAQVPSSPEDRYLAFKHLCDRYEQPALYVAWLTETAFCHPSYSSAVAYTKGGDSLERTGLLSQVDGRPADTGPTVAVLLLIASQGFQRLFIGAPWADKLKDLETRLGQVL